MAIPGHTAQSLAFGASVGTAVGILTQHLLASHLVGVSPGVAGAVGTAAGVGSHKLLDFAVHYGVLPAARMLLCEYKLWRLQRLLRLGLIDPAKAKQLAEELTFRAYLDRPPTRAPGQLPAKKSKKRRQLPASASV